MQQEQHDDREAERRRVDEESRAGPEGIDDEAAHGRADERERRLADELRQRVCLHEEVPRDEVRDDRARRWALERLAGAEEHGEDEDVPQLDGFRDREHSENADRDAAERAGEHQHLAALEPVRDDPAHQDEGDNRDRLRDADDCQRRR